jgi:hypothetical protein
VNEDQQAYSQYQYNGGDPELNVGKNGPQSFRPAATLIVHWTPFPAELT